MRLNHQKFPELATLLEKLNHIPMDKTQPNPFLHHLEQLAQELKAHGQSYIGRHLHYHFTQDVAALAYERELLDSAYYLDYVA
jgi:hypothetical protein